jgi:hypothetical protein
MRAMGRFERSDRDHEVDLRAALRRAHEQVARNHEEAPPPGPSDDERELEEVEEALRHHDERLREDDG